MREIVLSTFTIIRENMTHEIAKIKISIRDISVIIKKREINTTEVQISRAIFERLQTPFQREELGRTS